MYTPDWYEFFSLTDVICKMLKILVLRLRIEIHLINIVESQDYFTIIHNHLKSAHFHSADEALS